jgi:hypothetical protein
VSWTVRMDEPPCPDPVMCLPFSRYGTAEAADSAAPVPFRFTFCTGACDAGCSPVPA